MDRNSRVGTARKYEPKVVRLDVEFSFVKRQILTNQVSIYLKVNPSGKD